MPTSRPLLKAFVVLFCATCLMQAGCRATSKAGPLAEKFPPVNAGPRVDGMKTVEVELILNDEQKRESIIDLAAHMQTRGDLGLHIVVWGNVRGGNPEAVTPDGTVWRLTLTDMPSEFHGTYGTFDGAVHVPASGKMKLRWMTRVDSIDRTWQRSRGKRGRPVP